MQEEIENKSITLVVNGSKFTGRMLKAAILAFLRYSKNKSYQHKNVQPKGKQSVKELVGQNQGVSSMDMPADSSVKAFEKYARKYGVDYAVKKVDGTPPKFVLFFKARDADAITSAMQDFTNSWRRKENSGRVSIRALLSQFKSMLTPNSPDRARNRDVSR